jgi:hypothetical protein
MPKPRINFAAIRGITAHLSPAETNLHGAIAANAELMASVIRAGAPMNVSPLVTHDMVVALASANADLVTGMGKTIAVHLQLADLRDRVGLRTLDYGGGLWKGEAGMLADDVATDAATSPVRLAATS